MEAAERYAVGQTDGHTCLHDRLVRSRAAVLSDVFSFSVADSSGLWKRQHFARTFNKIFSQNSSFFSFCRLLVKRSSVSPMCGEEREAFPYRHVLTRWAFTEYLPPNLSPPLVQAEVGAHYSARDSCKFAECSVREPSGRGLLGVRGRPWCLTLGPF